MKDITKAFTSYYKSLFGVNDRKELTHKERQKKKQKRRQNKKHFKKK